MSRTYNYYFLVADFFSLGVRVGVSAKENAVASITCN